ncbi:MAG: PD-(D/E)XK nuclease family transposase [Myxococcota bacterium]
MWNQKNFQQRALYNAAKLFVDQLGKSEDYAELRKVTLLSILNFPFLASN